MLCFSIKNKVMRGKCRLIFHGTLRPIFKWLLRNKEVWYFEGIRRSGNHACIYWVANARLGMNVKPMQLSHYLFYCFSENCVFINSYAQESAIVMLLHVWKNRKFIRRCKILFLSIEDESSELIHFLNARSYAFRHIGITRSLPNVLASRLQKQRRESMKPGDGIAKNFEVTLRVLNLFFKAREAETVWMYDDWVSNSSWRREFLSYMNLKADIMPGVTPQGGGSSFETKEMNDAQNERFKLIECPTELHSILVENRNRLPRKEWNAVQRWLSNSATTQSFSKK